MRRIVHQLNPVDAGLSLELSDTGPIRVVFLLVIFVLLGFGIEFLYRKAVRAFVDWMAALPTDTPAGRVRLLLLRLGYGVGQVCAFALGSIGASSLRRRPCRLNAVTGTFSSGAEAM